MKTISLASEVAALQKAKVEIAALDELTAKTGSDVVSKCAATPPSDKQGLVEIAQLLVLKDYLPIHTSARRKDLAALQATLLESCHAEVTRLSKKARDLRRLAHKKSLTALAPHFVNNSAELERAVEWSSLVRSVDALAFPIRIESPHEDEVPDYAARLIEAENKLDAFTTEHLA